MPQAANLSLNNGTVAKTYVPVDVRGNSAVFQDQSGPTDEACPTLTIGVERPTGARKTTRVPVEIYYPEVVQDSYTSPATNKVASVARFKGYAVVPSGMSAVTKTEFWNIVKNALATANFELAIKKGEPTV